MDIRRALLFAQDDEKYISKVLIAVALVFFSFLIIPAFILYGYMLRIVRTVIAGSDTPLPEWDDWGGMLKDGFLYTVAGVIYTAPLWLLVCCSSLLIYLSSSGGGDFAGVTSGIGLILALMVSCLVMIFIVLYIALTPAIAVQYARFGTLGACLRVGEVLGLVRDHAGDILIAVAVLLGLSLVLSFLLIIPVLGWIIYFIGAAYVTYFVTGHLYGQIGAAAAGAAGKEKALPV